jgi:acyl-CoA synthetase (AMP-forming)/AMP-acid ligase II
MLTHRNLVANICQDTFERPSEQWADDRVIAVLPFLSQLRAGLAHEPAGVLRRDGGHDAAFDLREFPRVIQDYRITIAYVVPPIVLTLVKHPLIDEFDVSSLDIVGCGTAPLSAEIEVACGKRLGCRIAQGYGLTETGPTTHRSRGI